MFTSCIDPPNARYLTIAISNPPQTGSKKNPIRVTHNVKPTPGVGFIILQAL